MMVERARKGDVHAMLALARTGQKNGDLNAAQGWYEKAAAVGDAGAMVRLAELAERQGHARRARSWRRRAAEAASQPGSTNPGP
ncbi:hypothetical protein ACQPZG_03465 (plasmid) [Streptomyces sp. CA-294286]|uniref:hypothetical protein n=1 Tax=Streptomyces sp. CA-294286 TaxID=3240070 RepID=UPI003D8A6C95